MNCRRKATLDFLLFAIVCADDGDDVVLFGRRFDLNNKHLTIVYRQFENYFIAATQRRRFGGGGWGTRGE